MSITLNKQEALVEIAKGGKVYPADMVPEDGYFKMNTESTGEIERVIFDTEKEHLFNFKKVRSFKKVVPKEDYIKIKEEKLCLSRATNLDLLEEIGIRMHPLQL